MFTKKGKSYKGKRKFDRTQSDNKTSRKALKKRKMKWGHMVARDAAVIVIGLSSCNALSALVYADLCVWLCA